LADVYGGIPPGWLAGKAPNFDWLPSIEQVAWSVFEWEQKEGMPHLENQNHSATGKSE
jgi:hypothetical protein